MFWEIPHLIEFRKEMKKKFCANLGKIHQNLWIDESMIIWYSIYDPFWLSARFDATTAAATAADVYNYD